MGQGWRSACGGVRRLLNACGRRCRALRGSIPASSKSPSRAGAVPISVAFALTIVFGATSPSSAEGSGIEGTLPTSILALIAIAVGTAMVCAFYLMYYRAALVRENETLRREVRALDFQIHDLAALLASSDQRLLAYKGENSPQVFGNLPADSKTPAAPQRFVSFVEWLPARAAGDLSAEIERLIDSAIPFTILLKTLSDELIEVDGRTHGDLALVRFTHMAGLRAKLTRAGDELSEALGTVDTLQALLDTAPLPAWLRDHEGKLFWVNQAYAKAIDGGSPSEVVEEGGEFFGASDRQAVAAAVRTDSLYTGKLSTVVEADRHIFEVTELAGPLGTAGIAIDISETENIRRELHQTIESQSETLDNLATAVARFDPETRLIYHNTAFKTLFDLDEAFLASDVDHLSFIDHLRHAGVLPTETAFPSQERQEELAPYSATGQTEKNWYLQGGKTLRVVATPHPRGGATFVFEDITERLNLEQEVKTTEQLQRETLDYLGEGVAVFGSDGRLRLSNPVFGEMFGLDDAYLKTNPRIQTFADQSSGAIVAGPSVDRIGWNGLSVLVTSIDEMGRTSEDGEITLSNGRIYAFKAVPLPNVQTMLTFSDISDAKAAERMLREKNDALEEANRIKYDFVSFMSYELRSPLTTIIGFSQLLGEPDLGTLNERQSDYLGHINASTRSLLAMVNDTLDLATIDAGIMELDVSTVDIASRVESAVEGIQERLHENGLRLAIDLDRSGAVFEADGQRLTQILYNLLSNAANFAPQGSEIELTAWREEDDDLVRFSVTDHGPGIPGDQVDRIFERFETNAEGGRTSGPGLGLSIVKSLVELHAGSIEVGTPKGGGTRVICSLPAHQRPRDPDLPTSGRKDGRHGSTDERASDYRDAAE